ncbi:signal peptidase I [Bacillus sp. 03113]|uniref:signal peptidase I n=1 Tax=Bacillus sp. 03113 TaxID=2578211 RepID=UPI0011432C2A|nr:signal peptidase I [Bacillus sp. 03113]
MKKKLKREGIEWVKAFGIGFIIFVFVRAFFFSSYVVEGESMEPTLENGNKLVINKIGYQIGDLHRFDVIVFHANSKEDYVKRVIGLPGDRIEYRGDHLYINDVKIEEPFLNTLRKNDYGSKQTGDFTLKELTGNETVPEGQLFVMGDNRLVSFDSRQIGFVSLERVVGKVNLRYWPMKELDASF